MALSDLFRSPAPANPTTPTAGTGTDDPNRDDAGAGESPIEPVNLTPPGVVIAADPPPPLISTDPGYIPPGAPRFVEQAAPAQNLGTSTISVAAAEAVRLAPGSSTKRHLTVTVHLADPADTPIISVSPDRRQDATGARLAPGQAYRLTTGSPLYVYNSGSDPAYVSVIIEPCNCAAG